VPADVDARLDSPPGERESVQRLLRLLAAAGAVLMFTVIVASAYMRLAQAGLSCADWPTCYGRADAQAATAGMGAARLVHRIAASAVGIVLLGALLIAIAQRPRPLRQIAIIVAALAIALFLAGLGSTLPAPSAALPASGVTLANLGGGFALLALLWWLRLSTLPTAALRTKPAALAKLAAAVALLAVVAQIGLGALVSAKLAALACPAFPGCGAEWPPGALFDGLDPTRKPSFGPNGEMLRPAALSALQWTHRLGALIVAALGAVTVASLLPAGADARRAGAILAVLLVAQLALGAAIVLASFPLALVMAHNACAALLLLALISANRSLRVIGRSE